MELRNDRRSAVKKIKTTIFTSKSDVDSFRKKIEKTFYAEFTPNRVERISETIGGVDCDILIPEVYSSDRILLYVHGGSFVGGSRESWKSFCSLIANSTSSKVIVPEFRLAPEHKYPAATDDITAVFKKLDAEEIIVAGDGSGANIAFSFILGLKETDRQKISKFIMFSPWLDFSEDAEYELPRKLKDSVLSFDDICYASSQYAKAVDIASYFVSPLKAEKECYDSFPEVYIQSGENEFLVCQIKALEEKLDSIGVENTVDIVPKMMHMFQMADEYLEEAHFAFERIGKFVNRRDGLSVKEQRERDRLIRENNITVE